MSPPSPGQLFRLLVALALTAFVLWRSHPVAVLDAARSADLAWIGVAVALVAIDRALMAYRSVALLCPIDRALRPPLRALLRVFFVSTFVGTFLPASIGGDAARTVALARLQVLTAPALASVLMDRLLGVVSILLMGAAGVSLMPASNATSARAIEISLLAAGAVSLVAGLVVFSETVAGLMNAVAVRLPFAAVRRIAAELTRATRAYGTHHGTLALVLAASISVQAIRIVQAYCLGRALHIDTGLGLYFALIPLILLVMLLPVSINGIGPSQAAFVWFFGGVGVPNAAAFALSVLFVALGIVGNLPGGLLYAASPPPPRASTPSP